jgi:Fic family protein
MHKLPFPLHLDTVDILKALSEANHQLGVLKGSLQYLPNPEIVLSLITLIESKDSSHIENIITTYDEIFKSMVSSVSDLQSPKEVVNYKKAVETGFALLKKHQFISTNILVDIQKMIEPYRQGIRKLPGTFIINDFTKEVVHTPPQDEQSIRDYLKNLEMYINDDTSFDPLIQVALIHFQFESIHPFYDGNGRTGRILNILYLVLKDKLDYPVLYLSTFIHQHRKEYYDLLKQANENLHALESFVLYMLKAITETAKSTTQFIQRMHQVMELTKVEMIIRLPDLDASAIVQYLFSCMYTKNEFFRNNFSLSRATATKYLKALEKEGFVTSEVLGKEVIYKNVYLYHLIKDDTLNHR